MDGQASNAWVHMWDWIVWVNERWDGRWLARGNMLTWVNTLLVRIGAMLQHRFLWVPSSRGWPSCSASMSSVPSHPSTHPNKSIRPTNPSIPFPPILSHPIRPHQDLPGDVAPVLTRRVFTELMNMLILVLTNALSNLQCAYSIN